MDCRARIIVMDEQVESIMAEFERKKEEILSVARAERQQLGRDLNKDKCTYEEALHLKDVIMKKANDTLEVANNVVEKTVRELAEHRNELIRKTNNRIDDITADLAVVLDAYGWFPDESSDDESS
ncbi:hypothetical protein FisN_11Hu350 [Fistulifera solaris]|uniref:Uncharacterized protein n=1 Tax=Fistulifera solaris TaxID=1519565 RepID=A0A1Z5K918_FISSO|nr:hypothetical protein FisN_11Hu350 [Fistulifera solaris]|eukprot:GAX22759.1 hypothetical protein FisN_11Hu350 [Fistulifera solaris]